MAGALKGAAIDIHTESEHSISECKVMTSERLTRKGMAILSEECVIKSLFRITRNAHCEPCD